MKVRVRSIFSLRAVGFDLLLVMADLTLQAADLFVVRVSLVEVAVAHHEGDEEEKGNNHHVSIDAGELADDL